MCVVWFQVFSGPGDRLMSRRNKAAMGNGSGTGSGSHVVGVTSWCWCFDSGWGSCKLRQQLLRLLKSLIYWSVWHVGAAVVDVFVVAVVISMPAHTAQPTDRRTGRFTLKGTHNNRPCRAGAGACVGFRFGFGSLLQPLAPSSGNFSWCEKVYLMANCRLPLRVHSLLHIFTSN